MGQQRDWELGGLTVLVLRNGFCPEAKPHQARYVNPRRASQELEKLWLFVRHCACHQAMLESFVHSDTR